MIWNITWSFFSFLSLLFITFIDIGTFGSFYLTHLSSSNPTKSHSLPLSPPPQTPQLHTTSTTANKTRNNEQVSPFPSYLTQHLPPCHILPFFLTPSYLSPSIPSILPSLNTYTNTHTDRQIDYKTHGASWTTTEGRASNNFPLKTHLRTIQQLHVQNIGRQGLSPSPHNTVTLARLNPMFLLRASVPPD